MPGVVVVAQDSVEEDDGRHVLGRCCCVDVAMVDARTRGFSERRERLGRGGGELELGLDVW
jgi:hypothetical protein